MRALAASALIGLSACSGDPPPLVSPDQITGDAINTPLTAQAGDARRGAQVFAARDQGHCVLCHAVSGLDAEFQGNLGPDLTLVGDRLSPAQLRLRIVDYQLVRPGTVMPSYFRNHDLHQVGSDFQGETILSAQDIEDLVAYLGELKTSDEDA